LQTVDTSPRSAQARIDQLEKRAFFWAAVGLGMLVAIALIGGWILRQVDVSDDWVDHTRVVISTNQQLLSEVKDAQSAERGYIITSQDAYLNAFAAVSQDIPRTLSRLRQLISDNPTQQRRVLALEDLIAQRMSVLDEGLRQRKESGFESAERVVFSGQGLKVMNQIQIASQEIENDEYELLQARKQTRQAHLREGFIAIIGASLLALLALLSAPLDVRRALRQRDAARQHQHESESRAHALFQAATQAIVIVDQRGKIVMANPATEKLFGYATDELVGQSIELLIPEKLRGSHVEHRTRYFNNPQSRPMGLGLDLQARRKDGAEFYAEISLSYIESARGTLGVAFVNDISRRRADELAIQHQQQDLRVLAGRLMTAQDEERRRIARDLHDDLSQKLAYLAMDIGKLTSKAVEQELKEDLRPLQARAVEVADSVRRISHQLHPSVLDDIGLEAALEQYCDEFAERSGIAAHFTSQNVPNSLPREVASSLYHIFQECLRNVSKHSQARSVFVTLEGANNLLRLSVRDEGVGLAPDRLERGASIGLVGMKERAHLVNGSVSIQSKIGQGTEVTVEVPVHA